jgi:transposase
MNHMIHIAAVTQLRLDTEGRSYYRRKRADGKIGVVTFSGPG